MFFGTPRTKTELLNKSFIPFYPGSFKNHEMSAKSVNTNDVYIKAVYYWQYLMALMTNFKDLPKRWTYLVISNKTQCKTILTLKAWYDNGMH